MKMRKISADPRTNWMWLFLAGGTCATAATQWVTIWVLARTAEPTLAGLYGLAMAWLIPVFAFCGLQLRPLLATEAEDVGTLEIYRVLRGAGLVAALLLTALCALAEQERSGFPLLLALASVPRFAEMIGDFSYGIRMRRGEFARVGCSQLARAALSATAFVATWLSTRNLTAALLASGLAAAAIVWRLDAGDWIPDPDRMGNSPDLEGTRQRAGQSGPGPHCSRCGFGVLADRYRPVWNRVRLVFAKPCARKALLRILGVAVPLALIAFMNQAVVSVPRLLMGRGELLPSLAIFTCLMSLLALPSLTATAYAAGLSPRFADAYQRGGFSELQKLTKKAAGRVLAVALPAALFLVAVGDPCMLLLFGKGYEAGPAALAGAGGFAGAWAVSAVYGTAATAARRIAPQALGFSLALAACGLAGWWLLPAWGLSGATWSLSAAGAVLLATYWVSFQFLGHAHARGYSRGAPKPAPSVQEGPPVRANQEPGADAAGAPDLEQQGVSFHARTAL